MNSIIPTTPESMKQIAQTDEQLINFSRAALEHTQTQLVESEHINEIIDNKAKLAAINEYIKRIDNSSKAKREAMNNLTESITRLERRLGQLIQQKRESGELVKQGVNVSLAPRSLRGAKESLTEIGINYDESSRAQDVAALPDDTFEEVIQEGRNRDRGLSQTFVREKGHEHKKKGKLGQIKAEARRLGVDLNPTPSLPKDYVYNLNAGQSDISTAIVLLKDDIMKGYSVGKIPPEAMRFFANKLRKLADEIEGKLNGG